MILKSSTSLSVVEYPRMPLAEVRFQPLRHLWTPQGLIDLGEPSDLREFKPCLLGTWHTPSREAPLPNKIENSPARLTKETPCFLNVD